MQSRDHEIGQQPQAVDADGHFLLLLFLNVNSSFVLLKSCMFSVLLKKCQMFLFSTFIFNTII